MALACRVLDTGLRGGRANIAFDAAMIELHGEGAIGDTLRFLRFTPTALVGRHQVIDRELDLGHCARKGIEVARRVTGGGAIYFDEGMLGWEIVLSRRRLPLTGLADYSARICEGAAAGLSRAFGIEACFRPRNDIEVGGRKLSGTGGFFDGDTLFFQGTVLIDVAPETVMAALKVPRAKLEKRGLDRPETRIVTLAELTGRPPPVAEVKRAIVEGLSAALGLETREAVPTPAEEDRAAQLAAAIGADEFVHEIDAPADDEALSGSATGPGGTVTAYLRLDGPIGQKRIRDALLTGDFFVSPPRLAMDLEAALRGVYVDEADAVIAAFLDRHSRPDSLTVVPGELRRAVAMAIAGADLTTAKF